MKISTRIVVSAVVVAGIAVACRDVGNPPPTAVGGDIVASRGVRHVNRYAFVGAEHNRALTEVFGRASHGRGRKTLNFCARAIGPLMTTKVIADARNEAGFATDEILGRSMKVGVGVGRCAEMRKKMLAASKEGKAKQGKGLFKPAGHTPTVAMTEEEPPPPPPQVQALLDRIIATADNFTTAANLDAALDPIIADANFISDTTYQALVLGAASIASSSAHYWEENYAAERAAASNAINAELAADPACAPEFFDPAECLEGSDDVTFDAGMTRYHNVMFTPSRAPAALALNAAELACMEYFGVGPYGDGNGGTIKSDIQGGIVGGIAGAWKGGVRGAVLGLIGGAAANSLADLWGVTTIELLCVWIF